MKHVTCNFFVTEYFMYAEASSPSQPGFNAKLVSPRFNGKGSCVRFFYYMYGANVGTLNVYAQTENGNTDLCWSMSGMIDYKLIHPFRYIDGKVNF